MRPGYTSSITHSDDLTWLYVLYRWREGARNHIQARYEKTITTIWMQQEKASVGTPLI